LGAVASFWICPDSISDGVTILSQFSLREFIKGPKYSGQLLSFAGHLMLPEAVCRYNYDHIQSRFGFDTRTPIAG
jgi:hypothetical protein